MTSKMSTQKSGQSPKRRGIEVVLRGGETDHLGGEWHKKAQTQKVKKFVVLSLIPDRGVEAQLYNLSGGSLTISKKNDGARKEGGQFRIAEGREWRKEGYTHKARILNRERFELKESYLSGKNLKKERRGGRVGIRWD